MTQKLSPAAQAVLDAFTEDNSLHDWKYNYYNLESITAALRAAADQGEILFDAYDSPVQAVTVENLLAIATELESH